jgi:hypothetical protein
LDADRFVVGLPAELDGVVGADRSLLQAHVRIDFNRNSNVNARRKIRIQICDGIKNENKEKTGGRSTSDWVDPPLQLSEPKASRRESYGVFCDG